jgi:hypothetical protein
MQTLRVHLRTPLPAHMHSGQSTVADVSVGNELGLWQRAIYDDLIAQHEHSTTPTATTHNDEQLAYDSNKCEASTTYTVEGIPLLCSLRQCVNGVYTDTATTATANATASAANTSHSKAAVTLTVVPERPVLSRNGRASFQVRTCRSLLNAIRFVRPMKHKH